MHNFFTVHFFLAVQEKGISHVSPDSGPEANNGGVLHLQVVDVPPLHWAHTIAQ